MRDGEGATNDATGAENSMTAETTTTAEWARRRRSGREHKQVSSGGAGGGGYQKEGTGIEESADKRAEWSGMDGKGLATEEEAETAVGAWGGQQNAGGDGVVYAGDWSGIATRGCYDRREQNREGHLCGRRQGRSGGGAMGKEPRQGRG